MSPAADSHPSRRRPSELQALIRTAAEDVFTRRGYSEATTIEIAEAAGVRRSVLYRHFPTKADLFRETMAYPFLSFMDDWVATRQAQRAHPLSNSALMQTFVAELYRNLSEHRAAVRLLFIDSPGQESEEHSAVLSTVRQHMDTLGEIVEVELRDRGFPTENAEITVRAVISMIVGMVVVDSSIFHDTAASDELRIAHVSMLILNGLALHE